MIRSFTIPLTPEPQTFTLTLSAREYRFAVRWTDAEEGGWILDIRDPETEAPILLGIPLITGADLFAQHGHLNFGGKLYVNSVSPPGPEDLGMDAELIFETGEEDDG